MSLKDPLWDTQNPDSTSQIWWYAGGSVLPYLEEVFIRSWEAKSGKRSSNLLACTRPSGKGRTFIWLRIFFREGQWNTLEMIQVIKRSWKIVSEKKNRGEMETSLEKLPNACVSKCLPRTQPLNGDIWVALFFGVVSGEVSLCLLTLLDLCIIPWCFTVTPQLSYCGFWASSLTSLN